MKGLKVNDLYLACEEQIEKGNGEKTVCISCDEEGNAFHLLFCLFTENVEEIVDFGLDVEMNYEDSNPDNYIILG